MSVVLEDADSVDGSGPAAWSWFGILLGNKVSARAARSRPDEEEGSRSTV